MLYIYNHENNKYFLNKLSDIYTQGDDCDLKHINNLFSNLCDLYNQNLVIGSLCDKLCKNYRSSFKLIKCYNNYNKENMLNIDESAKYDDYKIVLEYEIIDKSLQQFLNLSSNNRLILKTRHKYFEQYNQYTYDLDKINEIKSLNEFIITYFESTINHNFKTTNFTQIKTTEQLNEHLLRFYDSFSFRNFYSKSIETKDVDKLRVFISNLLTLLQQDEYLFYKYYASKRHTLSIFGTCGHFYAIEKATSINTLMKNVHFSMNINERKQLIIKFLDLIEYFDKRMSIDNEQSSIEICDVKLDNFGMSSLNNELKLIDTDMVFSERLLFLNQNDNSEQCKQSNKCHFFDCKSYCGQNGKCISKRVNNNLQMICEKIFSNPYIAQEGLITGLKLINTNFKNKLLAVLDKCITPGYYQESTNISNMYDRVKVGANYDVANEIRVLINSDEFY